LIFDRAVKNINHLSNELLKIVATIVSDELLAEVKLKVRYLVDVRQVQKEASF
jgi:hypothetical protein